MCHPAGVAVDSAGNLFVADASNNRVLGYNTPTRNGQGTDIIAAKVFGQQGNFTTAFCDGTNDDPTPDTLCLEQLPPPTGLPFTTIPAIDSSDNLWIADAQNGRVLEYDQPFAPGGGVPGTPGHSGDTTADFAIGSGLNRPTAVALDPEGNVYVRDESNLPEELIANYGRVLGYFNPLIPASPLCPGCGDGVADFVFGQNRNLNTVTCAEEVDATTLSCDDPIGLATDSEGSLFAADSGNNRILEYDSPTTNQTANLELGQPDFSHSLVNLVDGRSLARPLQITIDSSGATAHLYVADADNNRVLGWKDATGFANGAMADIVIGQSDFASTAARDFSSPEGVAVDRKGNLYIADTFNSRVLEYPNPFAACGTFPCVLSQVEGPQLVFGQGPSGFPTEACPGGASADSLSFPFAVTVDTLGNVYISDTGNNRVLEYYSPLAGSGGTPGRPGSAGDTTADLVFGQGDTGDNFGSCSCVPSPDGNHLCGAAGVAVDLNGNVYIADGRVDEYFRPGIPSGIGAKRPGRPHDVTADVIFGQAGFGPDGCVNGADCVYDASAVVADALGNVFVADAGGHRVLEYFDPGARGGGTPGKPGSAGDTTADLVLGQNGSFDSNTCNQQAPSFVPNGSATASTLCFPSGVALDNLSNLFVSDSGNHRVLEFNVAPVAGSLALAPKVINFGVVGQNSSKSRKLTIRNVGRGKNAVAVGIQVETAASPFGIQNQCFGTLAVGERCSVIVTFAPTDTMPHTGTLIIDDNLEGGPQQVQLSGTGRAPIR
ncbi:MAG TPA: choice-of-anchor D domain-containing protein [Candidatus Binataceae bacterium]|nr:choice-of-anchor D domain-containing protein [Candidatus Binataceae bacterium]